jgi:hypothetical protein
MGMIDVADPLPGLSITTTSGGVAADPTTLTLTITLPDGTTKVGTWPAAGGDTLTITRASAGNFSCTFITTLPGRHTARWVAVGGGTDKAHVDAWNVAASTAIPLISLADIREQCRASSTAADEELRWYGLVASRMAEDHTQIWRRTTLTETFDGGRRFLRLRRPVVSVTLVVEGGTTVTSTGWVLNAPRGKLYRGTTSGAWCWADGVQNVTVTYVAGVSDGIVPEGVLQGVRLETQHLWDSQRGGSNLPRQAGADFSIDPRTGFSIPNRVLELWRSEIPQGGVFVA